MAVPKRRQSKGRTAQRRSAWMASFAPPTVVTCSNCKEPKLPHRVCGQCGYYAGRQVVAKEEN